MPFSGKVTVPLRMTIPVPDDLASVDAVKLTLVSSRSMLVADKAVTFTVPEDFTSPNK